MQPRPFILFLLVFALASTPAYACRPEPMLNMPAFGIAYIFFSVFFFFIKGMFYDSALKQPTRGALAKADALAVPVTCALIVATGFSPVNDTWYTALGVFAVLAASFYAVEKKFIEKKIGAKLQRGAAITVLVINITVAALFAYGFWSIQQPDAPGPNGEMMLC
ncbi:MAG: hypothetical protein ACAH80_05740 [Alphaproteobacteria bacterium]